MENRGKRQAASIFGGMGFYIALLVCVLAAGVVGYFALLDDGSNETTTHLENDDTLQTVDQTESDGTVPVDVTEETPSQSVMGDSTVIVTIPDETNVEADSEVEEIKVVTDTTPTVNPEPVAQDIQETPQPVSGEIGSDDVDVSQEAEATLSSVVAPILGETVAVFSLEELTYNQTTGDWRTHDGIDIQAAAGTAVSAAADGTVLSVEDDGLLGVTVVIEHDNGYVTTYANLHPETNVLAGDSVSAGSIIGAVGETSLMESGLGAHLHFSVTKDGETIDPLTFLE